MPRFQFLFLASLLFNACKTPEPLVERSEHYYNSVSSGLYIVINNDNEFDITRSTRCLPVRECLGTILIQGEQITFYSQQDEKENVSDSIRDELSFPRYKPIEEGIIRNDSIFFRNEIFVRKIYYK